jgi:hypothetical protein
MDRTPRERQTPREPCTHSKDRTRRTRQKHYLSLTYSKCFTRRIRQMSHTRHTRYTCRSCYRRDTYPTAGTRGSCAPSRALDAAAHAGAPVDGHVYTLDRGRWPLPTDGLAPAVTLWGPPVDSPLATLSPCRDSTGTLPGLYRDGRPQWSPLPPPDSPHTTLSAVPSWWTDPRSLFTRTPLTLALGLPLCSPWPVLPLSAGCPRCWWLSSGVLSVATGESSVLLAHHLWDHMASYFHSLSVPGTGGWPPPALGHSAVSAAPPPRRRRTAGDWGQTGSRNLWGVWGVEPPQEPSR